MQDHLGVGGRLHDRPFAHQIAAKGEAVGQIAVVPDGEAAGVELREQRLHVAQDGAAGRGITHVPHGDVAGEPLDHLAPGEGIPDQSHPPFGMEALAVEGDDPGRFLAAVLQGVQPERGDRRRVRVAENPEDAAFLAKPIGVEIEGRIRRLAHSVSCGRRIIALVPCRH